MIVEAYFKQLASFLDTYREIWEKEVIQKYPASTELYNDSFINSLCELSESDLYKYCLNASNIPEIESPTYILELENLISQFDSHICRDYQTIKDSTLPIHSFQNLKDKKRHELINLYNFLSLKNEIPTDQIVIDYCGGAGYLARNLAYYYETESISIDIDSQLQRRGKERSQRFIPKKAKTYQTIHLDITNHDTKIPARSPSIAVHACGDLLDSAIQNSIDREASWILAIGCCYHKTNNYEYNFSELSQKQKLNFTVESLLLASRGHDASLKSFSHSLSVKKYRYILHILLKKYLGYDFMSVGECKKEIYTKSFEEYAYDRLSHIFGENQAHTYKELIYEVSQNDEDKFAVKTMLMKNIIRSKFSRPLEIIIALDRMLYLKENDYLTELYHIFDVRLSQRNIGIWAKRIS